MKPREAVRVVDVHESKSEVSIHNELMLPGGGSPQYFKYKFLASSYWGIQVFSLLITQYY